MLVADREPILAILTETISSVPDERESIVHEPVPKSVLFEIDSAVNLVV